MDHLRDAHAVRRIQNYFFSPTFVSLQLMQKMIKSYWHHWGELQVLRYLQEEEIWEKGEEGGGC